MVPGLVGVLLCLAVAMSPWVWIRIRRGTSASSWGTPPVDHCIRHLSRDVSQSFSRSLQGRWLWVWFLLGGMGLLYLVIVWQASVRQIQVSCFSLTVSYTCCWLTGLLALLVAWFRMGRRNHVNLGLLANFFLSGGVLGSTFAMVLNSELILNWQRFSPTCNLMKIEMNARCNALAELMWLLTPGLVEETFKSVWLFFRLRRGLEDLPGRCCFCLPASRTYDCGCWFKLAPTPYHVLLCALASGAGFESFENLLYVFWNSRVFQNPGDTKAAQTVLAVGLSRLATSGMHMIWTGLIGLGLARQLFLQENQRPSLLAVLLPSMLAHGTFDYSVSALQSAAKAQQNEYAVLYICMFVGVIVASCCRFGALTGCKGAFFCGSSCCCAPDFWGAVFGIGAADAARQMVGQPVIQLEPPPQPAPLTATALEASQLEPSAPET